MSLTNEKCIPCQGGEPTLTKDEIGKYLPSLKKGWKVNGKKLTLDNEFKDFNSAINFVNKVAKLAEAEGHHPDILIYGYNKVRLELWTHKIGGLHKNDFILASKIETL